MNLAMAVVGTAGAGKTLFCINFAEYMGAGSLSYSEVSGGNERRALLSPAGARNLMVGRGRRGNGVLRTFTVHLTGPLRRLSLIDTAALPERDPLPRFERSRLALTLQAVAGADLILLLIDVSCADPAHEEFNERAEGSLAAYCRQQGKLFLTGGSKADLLKRAPEKHRRRPLYAGANLLLISSVTGLGFARVRGLIRGGAALSAAGSSRQVIN
ncbi:MAG: GTPase domain-containing protein [Firmicutes bacterium]|nr:GTPase domain-containing protein [Bacillota bacterium]